MKELILLCAKVVHFTFNGKTYIHISSVAMVSPLGPVLSGIFMVELENNLIQTLSEHLACRERYVDDTISFIKNDSIVQSAITWKKDKETKAPGIINFILRFDMVSFEKYFPSRHLPA